jgi:PhzF family phenazine biosynthesis protein
VANTFQRQKLFGKNNLFECSINCWQSVRACRVGAALWNGYLSKSMPARIHVVDAFTSKPFEGNPAGVCVLKDPADEQWMQKVAGEMNLSETAFVHAIDGGFSLRWFTPAMEVDLCGHATLACAFTLWETGMVPRGQQARFLTRSGWLHCRESNGWIEMDFPAKPCTQPAVLGDLLRALDCAPVFAGSNGMDYLVELSSAAELRALRPDFAAISRLPCRGVIVTARADSPEFDFVSRFFAPAAGINEDPVTGSAHCALGPHWAERLGKTNLTGFQASRRSGVVKVRLDGERVILSGLAVLMSRVELLH